MGPRRCILALAVALAATLGAASPASAAKTFDLTGTWNCCGAGGAAVQNWIITNGRGSIAGRGEIPGGRVFAALSGSVSGNHVTIIATYNDFAPGYVGTAIGTLSADGNTMSGTWSSTWNQHGTWTATREKPQKEAALIVAVTAPADVSVGDVANVTVKVTASGDDVKGISFGNGLVSSADPAVVTQSPGGLSGFSLADGASRTFQFKVKGAKTGSATLSAKANGETAAGDAASGADSTTVHVGQKGLVITLNTTPKIVELEVDDKGKVSPSKVAVKVTITNKTKLPIEGVQLLSLNPQPVDLTQALDQLAFAKGTLPIKFGTFAPKSSASRTLTLEVTGDGEYQLRALALFNDPSAPGGNGRVVETGGKFEVTVPVLYFSTKLDPQNVFKQHGEHWVDGGKWFFISGTVKNLSSYKILCVRPLDIQNKKAMGNATATGMMDLRKFGLRDDAPPAAGALKPGVSMPVGMWVQTSSTGGTRATIKFDPGGAVVKDTGACTFETINSLKPLKAKEMKIAPDSTEQLVRVDVSVTPPPDVANWVANLAFFGGVFIGGPIDFVVHIPENLGELILGITHGGMSLARQAWAANSTPEGFMKTVIMSNPLTAAPFQAQAAWSHGYALVRTTGQVLGKYWETATPAEKNSLIDHISSVLLRADEDFWKGAAEHTRPMIEGWLGKVEAAYAGGNDPELWAAVGTPIGSAGTQFIADWVSGEVLIELGRSVKTLQGLFKAIGDESKIYKSLRELPKGKLLNLTELQELWGFAKSDITQFQKIAKEYKIRIGVRGRNPISIKHLDEGAVWKHENLKPKNVNAIDYKFLGFDKADDGLVTLKKYSAKEIDEIEARIASERGKLTKAEQTELDDRWKTRKNEAKKYLDDIQAFDKKGQIDVGFNYRDNGIGAESTVKLRGFELQESTDALGSKVYRPLQENTALKPGGKIPKGAGCKEAVINAIKKILCRVTGDMDGVYLAEPNGTPIPTDKLMKVYEALQEAGWQHPETLTWVDQMGEGGAKFWFAKKEEILGGLELGGEAMAEIGPDGVFRAAYLDLKKTIQQSFGTGNWKLGIQGGFELN